MKKRKGAALVLTLVVFCVLIAFGSIVATLTMNNAHAARLQRQRIQAYYLVLAGMEIGTNAVMTEFSVTGDDGNPTTTTILKQFYNDKFKDPLEEELDPKTLAPTFDWDYDGKIQIRIQATDIMGNRPDSPEFEGDVYVEIAVVGTVSRGTNVNTSHAGTLRMLPNTPAVYIREVEVPTELM